MAADAAALIRRHLGSQVRILWYGSWTQGKAHPSSDIDLAVCSSRPISPAEMGALSSDLEELPTLYQISLVDLGSVEAGFVETIYLKRAPREMRWTLPRAPKGAKV